MGIVEKAFTTGEKSRNVLAFSFSMLYFIITFPFPQKVCMALSSIISTLYLQYPSLVSTL